MQFTKSHQRLIKSLSDKKNRDESGLFIAEGRKLINDLIETGLKPAMVFQLKNYLNPKIVEYNYIYIEVSEKEMSTISKLQTPPEMLAVFNQIKYSLSDFFEYKLPPIIFLDEIQDPGNLGTIIRTADWFGIKHIACSLDTVDCYNPKVIQATMGSIARVKIIYIDKNSFFNKACKDYEIIGTFMNGDSIFDTVFKPKTIIVIGNEGKGISNEVQSVINKRISIPKSISNFGKNNAESLNASVAASIICYEFAKQMN